MPDDSTSMYPAEDPNQGESSDQTPKSSEGGEDEKDMGETALLPKTILAGKKFNPGDEVVLKIVHLYDDEVEVAYATDKHDESMHDDESMEGAQKKLGMMGSDMTGGGGY